jgi:hypothetical protein
MTNGMISISPSSTSHIYVVIFQLHLHMAYTYRSLFDMQELARHTISFEFEAVYWQISWCHRGFNCLVYRQLSANSVVVTTILFTHTTFLWATCCLICFIPIVNPFLTHWSWLRVVLFLEYGNGAHGGCDRSTGDAYSSMAPDPTSDIFRGPCTPILWFVFPIRLMRLITDRYFRHFINNYLKIVILWGVTLSITLCYGWLLTVWRPTQWFFAYMDTSTLPVKGCINTYLKIVIQWGVTLLAQLSWKLKWAFLIAHCPSSVRLSVNFYIFDFFSRTTWPILTRLGTNHPWGREF